MSSDEDENGKKVIVPCKPGNTSEERKQFITDNPVLFSCLYNKHGYLRSNND